MVNKKDNAIGFSIRVDKDLKDAFINTCSQLDTTASREIRLMMRKFIREHSQQSLKL